MRKLIFHLFIYIALFSTISCNSDSSKNKSSSNISTDLIQNPVTSDGNTNKSGLPEIKFQKLEHDFGAIIDGEKVSYTFKFENTGGSDLVITSAKGSCGCTVPKFSKEPIPAGKSGEIEIIFDSSGKSGVQHKTVTVLANTQPNTTTLTVTAEIITPNK
ncbi:MAG: hypothetical protein A2033_07275 [Bacteroidetes bacterium GWA2_31_9]|nr:MAG: hypothetical protein A2033_07275 [Bacteroidetes bacterium GWA2_31_9]